MKYVNLEKIKEQIKKYSTADEYIVLGEEVDSTNIRFHNNRINREFISRKEIYVVITSYFGARSASVVISSVSDEDIQKGVALSEELAKNAPEDPEYISQLESTDYSYLKSYLNEFSLPDGLNKLKEVFDNMKSQELSSFGSLNSYQDQKFILNNRDLCHSVDSSFFNFNVTAKIDDATGWAEVNENSFNDLDFLNTCRRASEKALLAREPKDLKPGKYTVILEAPAMAELILFMIRFFSEKDVDRELSPFSGKSNTTISNKELSLISSIDEKYKYMPWSREGVAARNIEIIKSGVLKELSRNRFHAEKKNKEPNFFGNFVLIGDESKEKSLKEIISETQNGILVTRFWYTRVVDPKALLLTGMTRGGLFQIENGKIIGSLKNFRFNESILKVLENIDLYSSSKKAFSESSSEVSCPHVRVNNFTFTSTTRF